MTGMRAAVYYGPHDIRIEEVERPTAAQGEILVRVNASGICGTDASEFVSGPKLFPLNARHPMTGHMGPIIPGHEFSGWVEEIGEYVSTDLKVGDLVVSGASLVRNLRAVPRRSHEHLSLASERGFASERRAGRVRGPFHRTFSSAPSR